MNKLTATIEFSFKGEVFKLSTILDLDDIMTRHQSIPALHQLLATQHQVDSYSYEYEMLLGEDILFSDPQGWVSEFVSTPHFDQSGFEQRWHEATCLNSLATLIKTELGIDDIHQHPALKKVLLLAYKTGKES